MSAAAFPAADFGARPPGRANEMPAAPEAERALLGAVLLRGSVDGADLDQGDFLTPGHRHIWLAILAVQARGERPDKVSVMTEMRARKTLSTLAGGDLYLAQLEPEAASEVPRFAALIRDKAAQRRAAFNAGEVVDRVCNADPAGALEAAARVVVDLTPRASDVGIRRMSDVEALAVVWLWFLRLPAGMLAVLDGPPGLGKSSVVVDLVARITTGRPFPGSIGARAPRDVILLGGEDSPAHTIRPRLDAAGADCARVHLLSEVDGHTPTFPADAAAVEKIIAATAAVLLVIDPISAHIGSADLHRDNEVRAALAPLAAMAERTGCTVLMLRHLRKSAGGDALNRGLGSIGITALARAGLMLLKDPDDESGEARILAWPKLSVGPQPSSLRWRFRPTGPGCPPRIEWDAAPCDLSADDILARQDARPARKTVVDDAQEFLRRELANGPVPSDPLERAAKDAGFGKSAYDRARRELGLRAQRRGATWYTALPDGSRTSARTSDSRHEDVGVLEVLEVDKPVPRAYFNFDEVGFREEPQGPQEPQPHHAGGTEVLDSSEAEELL